MTVKKLLEHGPMGAMLPLDVGEDLKINEVISTAVSITSAQARRLPKVGVSMI